MKTPSVNAKNTRCHLGRARKTLRISSKCMMSTAEEEACRREGGRWRAAVRVAARVRNEGGRERSYPAREERVPRRNHGRVSRRAGNVGQADGVGEVPGQSIRSRLEHTQASASPMRRAQAVQRPPTPRNGRRRRRQWEVKRSLPHVDAASDRLQNLDHDRARRARRFAHPDEAPLRVAPTPLGARETRMPPAPSRYTWLRPTATVPHRSGLAMLHARHGPSNIECRAPLQRAAHDVVGYAACAPPCPGQHDV